MTDTLHLQDLPTWLLVGDVHTVGERRLVRTETGGAWIPETARRLETLAVRNGWGCLLEVFCDSYGPVIFMSVGRNAGPTKGGRYSIGATFRLRWDCVRTPNVFELQSKYIRSTTTEGQWDTYTGTLYDIHSEIKARPVPLVGETLKEGEQT